MSNNLSPYRINEIKTYEYKSKWTDLVKNVRYIKNGISHSVIETFKTIGYGIKQILLLTTSFVWAPLLFFWYIGSKKDGKKFFLNYEDQNHYEQAHLRLSKSKSQNPYDKEVVKLYKSTSLVPIVHYEDSLMNIATVTGIIDAFAFMLLMMLTLL